MNRLPPEEEQGWIRRGIEARRTRNAGRVTRLLDLRNQRAARREMMDFLASSDAGLRAQVRSSPLPPAGKGRTTRIGLLG